MPRKTHKDPSLARQVPKLLMTYSEAAWSMGISKAKLEQMVSRGRISFVRVDGRVLFRPGELASMVEALPLETKG